MGKPIPVKYAATPQYKSNLRNIRGTFAAEGMTISKSTRSNLDRIASGQTSYQQVLTELRAKYEQPLSSPFRGAFDAASPERGGGPRSGGGFSPSAQAVEE